MIACCPLPSCPPARSISVMVWSGRCCRHSVLQSVNHINDRPQQPEYRPNPVQDQNSQSPAPQQFIMKTATASDSSFSSSPGNSRAMSSPQCPAVHGLVRTLPPECKTRCRSILPRVSRPAAVHLGLWLMWMTSLDILLGLPLWQSSGWINIYHSTLSHWYYYSSS